MDENKMNSQEIDEESDIVELIADDGEIAKFYHIATIQYKDDWFVFFQPVEKMENVSEDEVLIFKLGLDDEGKDVFLPIEDEKLLQEVYDEFVKNCNDEDDSEQ